MARQVESDGTELSREGGIEFAELDVLAARARAGDRAALGDLWEAAQPVVAPVLRQYAYRKQEGLLEAADLAQQGFLILAGLVANWQGQGPFVAWLRRSFPLELVRYRRSLLHWDGPRVETLSHEALATVLEARTESAVPDPFDTVLCRQLLAELPAQCRALLVWRFAQGLPYRDIERLHGIPATTAQVRCEQALAYLRARVEDRPAPPLSNLKLRTSRMQADVEGTVRALWALAAADGGLLPPASEAARALGLGRRAYDDLATRLQSAGCLGRAAVSFASRKGRRRQVVVSLEEALRRLALAQVG